MRTVVLMEKSQTLLLVSGSVQTCYQLHRELIFVSMDWLSIWKIEKMKLPKIRGAAQRQKLGIWGI